MGWYFPARTYGGAIATDVSRGSETPILVIPPVGLGLVTEALAAASLELWRTLLGAYRLVLHARPVLLVGTTEARMLVVGSTVPSG